MIGALVTTALTLGGYAAVTPCPNGLLAEIGPDATVTQGGKADLIAHVLAGHDVRVGWSHDTNQDGQPEIIHWDHADFLSVYKGEVFAQLTAIHRQRPKPEDAAVHLSQDLSHAYLLLGTNGTLETRFESTNVKKTPVKSWWCSTNVRPPACQIPAWRMVYRHDRHGRRLNGDKTHLFDAIRRGQSIRVAWGHKATKDNRTYIAEHSADPVFVTITGQKELVVQISEHIFQTSYHDAEKADFSEEGKVMWRGMLSTNGAFQAIWVDRATGETLRRFPQRTAMAWYAFQVPPSCPQPPPPLLAVPLN